MNRAMASRQFKDEVYAATRRIPCGRVTSYALLAAAIGRPHAARAVGNALHRNPTPGPVPCHRVVRSNGNLGGYVHGGARKRSLLMSEGVRLSSNGRIASPGTLFTFMQQEA